MIKIDSFLSIPEAESLPLYRMVLKLASVINMFLFQSYILNNQFMLKLLHFQHFQQGKSRKEAGER
jgi:hypothetical protein